MDRRLEILDLKSLASDFVASDIETDGADLELKHLPEGRFVAVSSKVSTLLYEVSPQGAKLLRKFDDVKDITNFKHNGELVSLKWINFLFFKMIWNSPQN